MEDFSDKELVTTITNLTDSECKSLQAALHRNDIPFIINEHGAHGKYQSYYFEIKVEKRNAEAARQIVEKHKAEMTVESKKCPKCGHLGHKKVDHVNWFNKIYYWGTTLVQCNKCRTKFGI